MNRKERRASSRRQHSVQRIRDLQHRVETTGLPGIIEGLHSACRDCSADGSFILLPGRQVIARIYHSDSCPAYLGVVDWAPVPITDEDTA